MGCKDHWLEAGLTQRTPSGWSGKDVRIIAIKSVGDANDALLGW
jgi:hypothetical protein